MFLEAVFADATEDVRNGAVDEASARDAAMEAVETYVPSAIAVFGYGSAFTGGYLPYSDVDIVALVEHNGSITNYCFMSRGIPVDLHVIGADSIDRIVDHAAKSGVSSILSSSIAGGKILHDPQGLAASLRERCAPALLEGPRPALPREIAALRWMSTTQLIDIAQDRPMVEIHAAALSAYPMLLRLCAIGAGTWRNRGKWAAAAAGSKSGRPTALRPDRELCDAVRGGRQGADDRCGARHSRSGRRPALLRPGQFDQPRRRGRSPRRDQRMKGIEMALRIRADVET